MSNADELKHSGLKATLPRIKILEVFQHAERRHMTAEDVYKALIGEGADIGLATVYRVLMQFEQAGLLTRSNFESGKSVFELNEGQHHDHLVCLSCGRVEEFFDDQIEQRQLLLGDHVALHDVDAVGRDHAEEVVGALRRRRTAAEQARQANQGKQETVHGHGRQGVPARAAAAAP